MQYTIFHNNMQYSICNIRNVIIFDAQQGEGGSLEILCLTTVMEQVRVAEGGEALR